MRTSTLEIQTPEGVIFSQLLAGPVTRAQAWVVDAFCVMALSGGAGFIFSLIGLLTPGLATAASTLSYFLFSIGYGIVCEWYWRGQTVGKRLCRLRVVDAEGLRLQFHQVVTRNLLRFVDSLPLFYFIGGIACWFSARCQRLGDIAANTIVIRYPRITEPDLDQLLTGKFNSLRSYPHIAARLRQRVTPSEAAIALQAILRRDSFDPGARLDLFDSLAQHFRSKADFPPEATDGITDEQYVRNIVDVLYRAAK